MNKYILTTAKDRITGLLLEDEKPAELRVYDEESRLGNIYVGRVSNVVKNINAAFVDIEKGLSCYMPLEDVGEGENIKIGDEILVQLSKEAVKTKQPTVTNKLSITGRYVVLSMDSPVGVSSKIKDIQKREELRTVLADCINALTESSYERELPPHILDRLKKIGGVIRTQAEDAQLSDIRMETEKLYKLFEDILNKAFYASIYSCMYKPNDSYMEDAYFFYNQKDTRLITDISEVAEYIRVLTEDEGVYRDIYYEDKLCSLDALYNVSGVMEKSLSRTVYLNSGAYLVIEPTEAMTVIDVNSGKAIKGSNVQESMHKINLEAAREIARQLRLRNISGIIMIDFISIKSDEKNKELLKALATYVDRDYTLTNVVDMTRLGLVEVTRKKIRRPLLEIIGYKSSEFKSK